MRLDLIRNLYLLAAAIVWAGFTAGGAGLGWTPYFGQLLAILSWRS